MNFYARLPLFRFLTFTDLEVEPVAAVEPEVEFAVEVEPEVVAVGELVPFELVLHDDRLDHEEAFQCQLVVSVS